MLATSRLIPNCSHLPQYFNIYIFIIRIERKFNYLFLNKIYIYFLSCIIENFALSLPGAGAGAAGSGSGAVIENLAPAPAPGGPKKAGSGSTSLVKSSRYFSEISRTFYNFSKSSFLVF